MAIHFITGNEHKLREAQMIIPNIDNVTFDLPEIQSLDPQKIIAEKLKEATKKHEGEFFIEDVSLYIESLNGFPGPLIKWLVESLGNQGIADLVHKYNNHNAIVKAVIGYSNGTDTHFFTGEVQGKIVQPRGDSPFGFDKIFLPNDYDKTYAEMKAEEKTAMSHRNIALKLLNKFLESRIND